MDNSQLSEFEHFLSFFPEIEFPVSISSQYFDIFSNHNKVIPQFLIDKYILGEDIVFPDEIKSEFHRHKSQLNHKDEETYINVEEDETEVNEFIACFRLPESFEFRAVVYLQISLLNYDYFLHTFDSAGRTISKKTISGMNYDGQTITEKAAMIDGDLKIWIMEGIREENDDFKQSSRNLPGYCIDVKGNIIAK